VRREDAKTQKTHNPQLFCTALLFSGRARWRGRGGVWGTEGREIEREKKKKKKKKKTK
jgi:hypothetical protein